MPRKQSRCPATWVVALTVAGIGPAGIGAAGTEAARLPQAGESHSCRRAEVLCVDDTPGTGAEFTDIQSAVDRAGPGDTVLVFDGDYAGFLVPNGGAEGRALRILAAGRAARIVSVAVGREESIYIKNASYVALEGFVVERRGARGFGIGARDASAAQPMRGLEIRNNVVRDSDDVNIYLSHVADSLIEGNVTTGSRTAHGIYLTNAGSDNTILRGNNAHHNFLNGIHFNGDGRFGGDGVQTGLLIDGNILHHNGQSGLNMDGVRDSEVRNNLVFANRRHALRGYAIDADAGPAGLLIVNNTFVANGGWAVKLTDDEGGHTLFNNILLSHRGSIAVGHRHLMSDANVVVTEFSFDGEETTVGFEGWQRAGYDTVSRQLFATDLFVAPADDDYRLLPNSPAHGFGLPMLNGRRAPRFDLAGQPRVAGKAPDVGALEVSGD